MSLKYNNHKLGTWRVKLFLPLLILLGLSLIFASRYFLDFHRPTPPLPAPYRVGIAWTPQDPVLGTVPSTHAYVSRIAIYAQQNGTWVYNIFPKSITTWVHADIVLNNFASTDKVDFVSRVVIYDPGGGIFADKPDIHLTLEPRKAETYGGGQWGWDEPGHWPIGVYYVEFYSTNVLIANGIFEITDN